MSAAHEKFQLSESILEEKLIEVFGKETKKVKYLKQTPSVQWRFVAFRSIAFNSVRRSESLCMVLVETSSNETRSARSVQTRSIVSRSESLF